MAGKLEFHFSFAFPGVIWNMLMVPGKSILLLEVRNDERRNVTFSALDFVRGQFLWKDLRIGDAWWVNLFTADEHRVVLTKFENTNNPDTVSYIPVDLVTGCVLENEHEISMHGVERNEVVVPAQYAEGMPHFETVKKFVRQKVKCEPVQIVEYLENSGLIFISIYTQGETGLENKLLVFNENGEMLLSEKLAGSLKGLGLETFFLCSGYLFYVRNKVELVICRVG